MNADVERCDRLLLLDFDGTVCVGDDPVWAYAEAVNAQINANGGEQAEAATARVRDRLAAYLAGVVTDACVDGYGVVAEACAGEVTPEQMQSAYLSSRQRLAEGGLNVWAPAGLDRLLEELGPRTRRVLVTNAPSIGIDSVLSAIGLDGLLDDIVTAAGKPGGWGEHLPSLLTRWQARSIMAVGDFWANDLDAPSRFGCCTALIDRFGSQSGPCNLKAQRFEDLFDGIRSWADEPDVFASSHAEVRTLRTGAAGGQDPRERVSPSNLREG